MGNITHTVKNTASGLPWLGNAQRRKVLHRFSKVILGEYQVPGISKPGGLCKTSLPLHSASSTDFRTAPLICLFFGNLLVNAWCLIHVSWEISHWPQDGFWVLFPPFSPQLHPPNPSLPSWCTLDAAAIGTIGNLLIDKISVLKVINFW